MSDDESCDRELDPYAFPHLPPDEQVALGPDVLEWSLSQLEPWDSSVVHFLESTSPRVESGREILVTYVLSLRPDQYRALEEADRVYEADPLLAMYAAARALAYGCASYVADVPMRVRGGFHVGGDFCTEHENSREIRDYALAMALSQCIRGAASKRDIPGHVLAYQGCMPPRALVARLLGTSWRAWMEAFWNRHSAFSDALGDVFCSAAIPDYRQNIKTSGG